MKPKAQKRKKADPIAQERERLYQDNISRFQDPLFNYIYSLVGNVELSKDILQETNCALWRKLDDFDPDRPFKPWAYTFAFNQVRAARKTMKRNWLLFLSEDNLELASQAYTTHVRESYDVRLGCLDQCINQLSSPNQELIQRRFFDREAVHEIATSLGRSANAISLSLFRIKGFLATCIEANLSADKLEDS